MKTAGSFHTAARFSASWKAPIFVARQLVKHKFLRWNEVSGRYVTFEPEFYTPDDFRSKAQDKKQGSGDVIENDTLLRIIFTEAHYDAFKAYKSALNRGLCEEQARGLLPLDLMTEWYWSGSLDAFAAMYNLRIASDTQYESRVVAQQIGEIIEPLFPVSWAALTGENDE